VSSEGDREISGHPYPPRMKAIEEGRRQKRKLMNEVE